MADSTYYAWTQIRYDADESGRPKVVNEGETVTASKIGVSKEEFEDMVERGVIRTDKYPDVEEGQSPREYFIHKAKEMEGNAEE